MKGLLLSIILFLFYFQSGLSQNKGKSLVFEKQQTKPRFFIGLNYNAVKFLDGTEFGLNQFNKNINSVVYFSNKLSFGIFVRNEDKIAFDITSTDVYYPFEINLYGKTIQRLFFQFNFNYLKTLYNENKNSLRFSGGISYRWGFERDFLVAPKTWEIRTYENALSDFGVVAGIELTHNIYKNFSLCFNPDFNYFIINKTNKKIAREAYPLLSGPTKGFIYLGIGLEYKL